MYNNLKKLKNVINNNYLNDIINKILQKKKLTQNYGQEMMDLF